MKERIKISKEVSYLCKKIYPLKDFYINKDNLVPSTEAVYIFWWMGDKRKLFNATKKIIVKGPGGRPVELKHQNLFPKELSYFALYIGKTTNLKDRITKHLLKKSPNKVYPYPKNFKKFKPKTTTCQLRTGVEYLFPSEKHPKDFIFENIGLSFFEEKEAGKRFYLENFMIGYLKPWINLDSER